MASEASAEYICPSPEKALNQVFLKSKKAAGGKQLHNFVEFYIDGRPLHDWLDEFYNNRSPLLNQWVGELKALPNNHLFEQLKIKHLLLDNITEDSIWTYLQDTFGATFSKNNFLYQFEVLKTVFDSNDYVFYACQECLDYNCGSYSGRVRLIDNCFYWHFEEEGKPNLEFKFDHAAYRKVLKTYLHSMIGFKK